MFVGDRVRSPVVTFLSDELDQHDRQGKIFGIRAKEESLLGRQQGDVGSRAGRHDL
jgi:hypothetical protein